MSVKTSDLTRGERLLISRRRRGESQAQAAKRFSMSLYAYRRIETGDAETRIELPIGRLEPFEVCFLRRRRTGEALHELASRMGLSRWWLCQMERGEVDAARLVTFWQGA